MREDERQPLSKAVLQKQIREEAKFSAGSSLIPLLFVTLLAILFTVITLVYRRRYQREQKALRASATVEEASSNGEHTATPAEDTAENTAEPPNGEQA
jgi:cytoskeletal protein RodZ